MASVQEFYVGQTIFLTGGSGFMGKVLLEKLLYNCSDLKKIFLLIRDKRGKTTTERINHFLTLPLFKRIKDEKPEVFDKIIPVCGEITLPNLGLSSNDYKMVIHETNIIFHMAATVTFDAPLRTALTLNLLATKILIGMAKEMKSLVVFIHLSTAFCCCDEEILEEKVYAWKHKPDDILDLISWMDDDMIEKVRPFLQSPHPNTYTYTKRLTEIMVEDEYKNLPICIVRPSIVLASYKDPFPGWVDNLNGPTGVIVAAGKGVLRSYYVNPEAYSEMIPVDISINSLLVVAWNYAMMKEKPLTIPVYNTSSRMTWKTFFDLTKKAVYRYPFENLLWYPDGSIATSEILHRFKLALTLWLPSHLIDIFALISGRKRFMVNIQKKIYTATEALDFFVHHIWHFQTSNFNSIRSKMSSFDNELFNTDTKSIDHGKMLENVTIGARQFCLKEPLESLPQARVQFKRSVVFE
ncbi:unnamed protein product [Diamesa hyperborea]